MPRRADAPPGWSPAQRRLHWAVAFLIILAFPVAWIMAAVPFAALLLKFVLFQVHKTLGLLVLFAALTRVLLRWRRGRPAFEAGLAAWERRAAASVHAALYGLMVLVPLLGYAVAGTAPDGIPTLFFGTLPLPAIVGPNQVWFGVLLALHRATAITLVALAAGHAAMAVRHHRHGLSSLSRIWAGQ